MKTKNLPFYAGFLLTKRNLVMQGKIKPMITVFEGDDGGKKEGDDDGKKSFTQEQVNSMLAKQKEEQNKNTQKAIDELNALKKKSKLTSGETKKLEDKIEELQNQILTKEEQSARDKDKLEKDSKKQIEELTKQSDTWRTRFEQSSIRRSIVDASAAHDAFSAEQIEAILMPISTLKELENDGEPTGDFQTRVAFKTEDKEGKPVTLDLSPTEAVKRMKESDQYLNLFKGEGQGGFGDRNKNKQGGKGTLSSVSSDTAAYRAQRKKGNTTI